MVRLGDARVCHCVTDSKSTVVDVFHILFGILLHTRDTCPLVAGLIVLYNIRIIDEFSKTQRCCVWRRVYYDSVCPDS